MDSLYPYSHNVRELWESSERRWLVSFRSPAEILCENPTFLALEIVMYLWAFLTLKHGMIGMHARLTHAKAYSYVTRLYADESVIIDVVIERHPNY